MADFEIAHKITSIFEGGYTNNPSDSGNWSSGKRGVGKLIGTNYGISAPVLATYLGREITVADMKNLSKETAKKIYRLNYWNPVRGDEIIMQEKANVIYDSAVNMGVTTAIILAQRALGIEVTGRMSSITLNTLNNKV